MPTPEQVLRNLQSQQSLRQAQDRNALLQRQRQMQQAQQQIQQQEAQRRLEAQRRQQEQSGSNEVAQYNYGRKLAMSGKGAYGLTGIERQGYIDAKEGLNAVDKYKKSIQEVKAQELPSYSAQQLTNEPKYKATITEISPQIIVGTSPYGTIQRAGGMFTGSLTAKTLPRQITKTNLVTGEKQYYEEVLPSPSPNVVSPAKTFTRQAKDIIFAPVERTRSGAYNLPAQVRKIAPLTSLTFRTGVAKVEQGLKNMGVGADSPLFKPTSIPVSRIVGDVALGSLLVGLSGSSGQIAVSRFVKDGRVYYLDSAGQVIGSESVETASKNIIEFRQALRESNIFKKAGDISPNEALLRERTRDLILKANDKQLKSLKELYKKEGRLDLYNDILAQERDIAIKTNIQSSTTSRAIRDKPAQLTGAGQVTSQFAGTGQYERTEQVIGGIPQGNKITNPMLLSNSNVAFAQNSFNRQRLAQVNSLGLSNINKQTQNQINQLGLRQPQETKQSSRLGLALLSSLRQQQQQRQVQKQILKLGSRLGNKERGRPRPRIKTPFGFNLPEDNIISRKGLTAKDILGFAVEVRRKGKFRVLGGAESSLQSALLKAERYVDKTLARSFRLRNVQTGELVSPSSVSPIFKASKREAKTFIEIPKASLGGSELKEISIFKRKKKKRGNLFGI